MWLLDVVEIEKTTLTPRSRKLFTLSALFTGTRALMAGLDLTPDEQIALGLDFWDGIAEGFPEWKQVQKKRASSAELRETFIYTHGLALHAIGLLGNSLLTLQQEGRLDAESARNWARLIGVEAIPNFGRARAMTGGRVQKGYQNVILHDLNALKLHLGVPLTDDEERVRRHVAGGGE